MLRTWDHVKRVVLGSDQEMGDVIISQSPKVRHSTEDATDDVARRSDSTSRSLSPEPRGYWREDEPMHHQRSMSTVRDLDLDELLPPRNTDQAGVAKKYKAESRRHRSNNPAERCEYFDSAGSYIGINLTEACQRIAQLEGQIEIRDQELQLRKASGEEMEKLKRQLEQQNQVMEDKFMALRAKLQAANLETHNLNIMHVQKATSLEKAIAHLHASSAKITSLQKNLEECKSRVFRYQPFQGPTDEGLSRMYEGLCKDIEDLVYTSFSGDESAIFNLESVQGGAWQLFQIDDVFQEQEVAAMHSSGAIAQAMLPSLLLRGLHFTMLQPEQVGCGLPAEVEKYLRETIEATKRLQPAKDEEARRAWIIDVFRAMHIVNEGRECCENTLVEICGMIINTAAIVGRSNQPDEELVEDCRRLVNDAAALARSVHLSTSSYTYDFDLARGGIVPDRVIHATEMSHYHVIDAATGCVVRTGSMPLADDRGRVGEKICCVYPALVRLASEMGPELVLCKATILVHFYQPIPRKSRSKDTV